MKPLLVVDGDSLAHRAYHAMPKSIRLNGVLGLANMRARAASIGGGFRLVSTPGRGTALEVVLRA